MEYYVSGIKFVAFVIACYTFITSAIKYRIKAVRIFINMRDAETATPGNSRVI
jgi:hypothetical protein